MRLLLLMMGARVLAKDGVCAAVAFVRVDLQAETGLFGLTAAAVTFTIMAWVGMVWIYSWRHTGGTTVGGAGGGGTGDGPVVVMIMVIIVVMMIVVDDKAHPAWTVLLLAVKAVLVPDDDAIGY